MANNSADAALFERRGSKLVVPAAGPNWRGLARVAQYVTTVVLPVLLLAIYLVTPASWRPGFGVLILPVGVAFCLLGIVNSVARGRSGARLLHVRRELVLDPSGRPGAYRGRPGPRMQVDGRTVDVGDEPRVVVLATPEDPGRAAAAEICLVLRDAVIVVGYFLERPKATSELAQALADELGQDSYATREKIPNVDVPGWLLVHVTWGIGWLSAFGALARAAGSGWALLGCLGLLAAGAAMEYVSALIYRRFWRRSIERLYGLPPPRGHS